MTYMDKLIEHSENLDTPLYLETKIQRHNNPHFWLQQDIAQIKHFLYRIFQNITLDDDTVPQIKIFSHFLLNIFRYNYQLLWEQQDQNAYIHFPQVLTELELLPYVNNEANKHLHYRDPTSLNISHLELIILDNTFLVEQSDVSDNRAYTSTSINPEILSEQFDSNNLQQDCQQDNFYSDDNIEQFQTHTEQFPNIQNTQQDINLPQQKIQYQITQPLELLHDLHYKLFPLTLYHTILQVQILILHNIQRKNNHHLNTLNPPSTSQTPHTTGNTLQPTQFQSSHSHSTTIRTNPHLHNTYTQPLPNTQNITSNASHTPTYSTFPTSTIPQSTVSDPTYIDSSSSISEPIKPFDGLDHNYTPEENLQLIEARVTFSLGLQPSATHEYKFWHARRMAFIQCCLTGTALSWYIRLNDTYKQDWHAFVQAFKKQFAHRKTLVMLNLKPSILQKSATKQYVILHSSSTTSRNRLVQRKCIYHKFKMQKMKYSQKDFPKTLKILPTNAK